MSVQLFVVAATHAHLFGLEHDCWLLVVNGGVLVVNLGITCWILVEDLREFGATSHCPKDASNT